VLFSFVGFEVTNKFAISNFTVFWNVVQVNEEGGVGSGDVTYTLTNVAELIAQPNFKEWAKYWVFH
jgi:hypothetical protein